MKRKLQFIFAFTVLFSTPIFSQGLLYEKGINDGYLQGILQIANKGEFTYALIRYDYHYTYLEKYDSLGTRLKKETFSIGSDYSTFQSNKMVITDDGNIWISGYGAMACDVPQLRQHVAVFNSDCQQIANYSKFLGSVGSSQNYAALSAIDDSSVAVNYRNTDSSWVEILTPSTQSILDNVHTPDLFGFGKNSQFHVLGHTINKIYGIDNQGALVDSITLPGLFREIGTWNDTIIVLGYNVLYKVTPDLQTYTTHTIPNLSNFTRLKIDNSGVRFIAGNFNLAVHYLDHYLNLLYLTTVPVFDPNNTIYDFDETVSVAKDFSLSEYSSIRLANYSLNNPNSNALNRTEVAVLDMQLYDAFAIEFGPGNVYQLSAKAMVLIKNNGANVLDSVRLNHHVQQFFSCGEVFISAYYSNLNLSVGDSMWVDFGSLGYYTNKFHGDSIERDYCIYSSNPNGIVDLNKANDKACASYFFGFVNLEENQKFDFKLYPNPSSDIIHLEILNHTFGKFFLEDQTGRIVKSGNTATEISLIDLQKGIYFITLSDKNGKTSLTQKVIRN